MSRNTFLGLRTLQRLERSGTFEVDRLIAEEAEVRRILGIGKRPMLDDADYRPATWERSEGGTTRTPTLSVSPDLLDWLQRAADPGAIDRAAERAAEKVARVFGGNGADAMPAKLPKTRRGFQRLAETTTQDQPILAALKEGKSYRQVARECNVGKTTVERVAKAYGMTGHAPEAVPLDGTLQENLSVRGKPGKHRSK